MANINDYLLWRGDLAITDEFKFNEIDSMILARFSYLIFDKIEMNEKETIESISNKMKDFDNNEFRYNGDKELITYLGKSNRFKNMYVTDYISNNDKEVEKQFGAITIHISDSEMYLSFIGTDNSIIGWKEDFNLSFMENIPAQIEGKNYTNKIAEKYKDKKIRIGGHSKGGNVAVYSAISVSKEIQDRIIKVYNYDGPGFDKKIVENNKNKHIIDRIETYIPQDSVIGRLLEHEEKYEIVHSIEKGLYQHDIYSWQVLKDDVVKVDTLEDTSEIINNTMREWLKQTTPSQRKIFFDTVFELFYSTSATTFKELSSAWTQNGMQILKKYKELSEEDKQAISQMLKEFAKAYLITMKENQKQKIQSFTNAKRNEEFWQF